MTTENANTATATAAGMMIAAATAGNAGAVTEAILTMDRAELARTLLAAIQIGATLVDREAEGTTAEFPVVDYLVALGAHMSRLG